MIPRADIDAVSSDIKINNLVSFINKTKHSRIPVFQDNLDRIIGMIHIRDLFEKVNNKVRNNRNLKLSKTITRKILFSSPSRSSNASNLPVEAPEGTIPLKG